jgi:hypothetical protein
MKYLTSWKKLSTQKPNKNFEIALIAESIEIRGDRLQFGVYLIKNDKSFKMAIFKQYCMNNHTN